MTKEMDEAIALAKRMVDAHERCDSVVLSASGILKLANALLDLSAEWPVSRIASATIKDLMATLEHLTKERDVLSAPDTKFRAGKIAGLEAALEIVTKEVAVLQDAKARGDLTADWGEACLLRSNLFARDIRSALDAMPADQSFQALIEASGCLVPNADQPEPPRWQRCPSTHCERRGECTSPSECMVKTAPPTVTMPELWWEDRVDRAVCFMGRLCVGGVKRTIFAGDGPMAEIVRYQAYIAEMDSPLSQHDTEAEARAAAEAAVREALAC